MKMSKKPLPIATICSWQKRIDPTPDYQRPPAWSRKQKQLLIDSILREYDIPKMYWRAVDREDGVKYEVIDGQQRLRAIWEFRADLFPLGRDTDPIDGIQSAGQVYSELNLDISTIFDAYPIDVIIVDDAIQNKQEDEVRDMFLRLQNGTTLKAQEKRNAMLGEMRDFVKALAEHTFLENCDFTNARYTFDHIAAQVILIELNGGPTNVKDADLNRMYVSHKNFDPSGAIANKIRKVFDFLLRAFPEKRGELKRYNVINLYCLTSLLIERYVYNDLAGTLSEWFIGFEHERWKNEQKPEEDRELSLVEYRRMISQSTDAEESIRGRLEMFEQRFFSANPDIKLKDTVRSFSHEQRMAIFRRGDGNCQLKLKCEGRKVGWDNWHADHIVPFVKGGTTTVSNGQVACPECNLSKGAS